MKNKNLNIKYFASNLGLAFGLVLIWRGMWLLIDLMDKYWFANNTVYTAVGGIVIGLLILYIPDKDLKELQKL
jgi:hypothetical protein